jgi:hypothetical protein
MTRDRQYIETFMARVGEAWRADPDSRFGQLTSNISRLANKSNARFDGLEEVSDLAFLHSLDRREREIAKASEESKRNARPPDAVFDALVYATKVDYDRWALNEFGRIGRDPARIGPFIERWSEFWNEHSEHRFGELLIEVLPPRPGSGRHGPHMRGELRLSLFA